MYIILYVLHIYIICSAYIYYVNIHNVCIYIYYAYIYNVYIYIVYIYCICIYIYMYVCKNTNYVLA